MLKQGKAVHLALPCFSLSKKLSESWAFCCKCGIMDKGDKNAEQEQRRKKSA